MRTVKQIVDDLEREATCESWGSSRPLLAEAAATIRELAMELRLAQAPETDVGLSDSEKAAIQEAESDLIAGLYEVVEARDAEVKG